MRKGSSGPTVERLQRLLGGLTPDGKFGPLTEKAVKDYQRAHGLVDDGIVGPKTWGALLA